MTLQSITRCWKKSLDSVLIVVCITMTYGCATITDTSSGLMKNGSILHKNHDAPGDGVDDDMFLVSIRAQHAYQESRWLEAVSLYQKIVERLPDDAVTWFRLANTYAQQGAFERAIHAYEQSLALDHEQPKAWFNLSTAYLLNAKSAMINAHDGLRSHDPARAMIQDRLQTLDDLVNSRLEENKGKTVGFHFR